MVLSKQLIEDGPNGKVLTVTKVGNENANPHQLSWTGSEHQIQFPLRPDIKGLKKIRLDLHGSATDTYDMGDNIASWLTKYMGFETRLVYIGQHSRLVLGSAAPNSDLAYQKRSPLIAPIRRILPLFLKTETERMSVPRRDQRVKQRSEVASRLWHLDGHFEVPTQNRRIWLASAI
jgi:hypothetical protein